MVFEDSVASPFRFGAPNRVETKIALVLSVERTVYMKMGREAQAAGLSRQAFGERLLNAAWAARFGQCGDAELEAVVAGVLEKVRSRGPKAKLRAEPGNGSACANPNGHAAARLAAGLDGVTVHDLPGKRRSGRARKSAPDAALT